MSEREEMEELRKWMREPDYAEDWCLSQTIDWLNRRPITLVERLAARTGQDVAGLREAALASIDMIENCADAPKNPDSLPEMVKVHLQQAIAALPAPAGESVTEEELARFINDYTGNDENGDKCARKMLSTFTITRKSEARS